MMSNNEQTLGAAIKQAREALGLTFGQAGNRTGLDPSTIWKAEDGKRVSHKTVLALAEGLGGDAAEWLRLAGFEPVAPSLSPVERLGQEYGKIALECAAAGKKAPDLAQFVRTYDGGFDRLTNEEADGILAKIRTAAGIER